MPQAVQKGTVACLQGIKVSVLGVDNIGKGIGYWNSLRGFWMTYFSKAGAEVVGYSVLRNPGSLERR